MEPTNRGGKKTELEEEEEEVLASGSPQKRHRTDDINDCEEDEAGSPGRDRAVVSVAGYRLEMNIHLTESGTVPSILTVLNGTRVIGAPACRLSALATPQSATRIMDQITENHGARIFETVYRSKGTVNQSTEERLAQLSTTEALATLRSTLFPKIYFSIDVDTAQEAGRRRDLAVLSVPACIFPLFVQYAPQSVSSLYRSREKYLSLVSECRTAVVNNCVKLGVDPGVQLEILEACCAILATLNTAVPSPPRKAVIAVVAQQHTTTHSLADIFYQGDKAVFGDEPPIEEFVELPDRKNVVSLISRAIQEGRHSILLHCKSIPQATQHYIFRARKWSAMLKFYVKLEVSGTTTSSPPRRSAKRKLDFAEIATHHRTMLCPDSSPG